jgi:dehydrogenase/reductase SDR family member 1
VLELGAAGATVYVTGRSAACLRPPRRRRGPALFARVRDEHGHLDVLVNNVYNAPASARWLGKRFWGVPPPAWDESFDIGLRSRYVASFHGAPPLIEASGLIVNISSPGAARYTHNAVYGTAKATLDRPTSDMAHDPAGTVVSLWPGIVNTELLQLVPPDTEGRRLLALPGEEVIDLSTAETPRFADRAVGALAADPGRLASTGSAWRVADLADAYGFTDSDGRIPRVSG